MQSPPQHRPWRRLGAVGVIGVAVAGLTLTACGSEEAPATATSKTFTVAIPAVPNNLDVKPFGGNPTVQIETALNSTLFAYDTASLPGQGCDQMAGLDKIKGALADTTTFSADKKTITVKLKDLTSSYGNKLTAEDVKWSIERDLALSSVATGLLTSTTHYAKEPVTVVSPDTVELHVTDPSPVDLAVLTHFSTMIVDSTEVKKHATASDPWANEWMQTHTADFGPWKLDSFQPGSQVTLVPNPNWKGDRGNVNKVIFKSVADGSTRAQLVQSGQIDWASGLSYSQFKTSQSNPNVAARTCKSPNRDTLILNFTDPALAKQQVRQAISMALNRQAIVDGAYAGLATPAQYGISSAYTFTAPTEKYTFDADQAKQLLAQAGYPNGFNLSLTYSATRPGPQVDQVSVLVQDQLGKIGIKVDLKNVAGASDFSNTFYGKKFQAILYSEPPAVADPFYSLAQYNISDSANNTFGWKDADYDQAVKVLAKTAEGPERDQLITKAAGLTVTDLPTTYLIDTPYLYVYNKKITGFNAVPYGQLFPHQLTIG